MNARSFWVYTVLRILFFLVPFGILMLLPIGREFYWLSAIFAALIGLSLSVIFLRRPLDEVSASLAERRARRTDATDTPSFSYRLLSTRKMWLLKWFCSFSLQ